MTPTDPLLSRVQSLTELRDEHVEEAERFASLESELDFCHLRELSELAAEALAKHRGNLRLDHLAALPEGVAMALSRHCGYQLSLNGLSELSDSSFSALCRYDGVLSLNGLGSVSPAQCDVLRHNHRLPNLRLEGLLSELQTRRVLEDDPADLRRLEAVTFQSIGIDLPLLEGVSDAAAEILFQYNESSLMLNGLRAIPDSVAEGIAANAGDLHLNGLTEVSDVLFKAMLRRQGHLSLNGLKSLPSAALEWLPGHRGSLSFGGLEELSLEEAAALSKSCFEVSEEIAWSEYCYSICLNGLKTLTQPVAAVLAGHEGPVRLSGLRELPQEVAEEMAKHGSEDGSRGAFLLALGMPSLSLGAAQALAKHRGAGLVLGVTALPVDVAEALVTYPAALAFPNLTSLSVEAARVLSRCLDTVLDLGGLTSLPEEVAAPLSQWSGQWLNFGGLTVLSVEAARCFSGWGGGKLLIGEGTLISEEARLLFTKSRPRLLVQTSSGPRSLAPADPGLG